MRERKGREGDIMSEHTATPWELLRTGNVIVGKRDGLPECVGLVFNPGHGKREANEFGPVARANAALILKAVNNFDEMRQLLSRALPWLSKAKAEGIHEHGVLPNDLDEVIRQITEILERVEGREEGRRMNLNHHTTMTGTNHFRSLGHAIRYYQDHGYEDIVLAVGQKINDEEIVIGPPKTKPGQRLILLDGGTRYGIEE